jgi:tetratricopeptide (TPR) repeat protein
LLASLYDAQGNPAEARRLWERSIALEDRIGDLEGRASTLIMLAQLEMMEGNRETALGMARESVRLLESIGNAKVTMAREILAQIETFDAGGSAEAPPFLAELGELLERAKAAGQEGGLAAIDAALAEARREVVPSREVVALLARSIACWNAGDVAGCDEGLRRAEEALGRVDEAERAALAHLVMMCKAQRAESKAAGPRESDRLYAEAMAKLQAEDMAEALGLFEASLAASRQEGDARGVAVNLLMIGQALLALGRVEEARERLREGLEAAQEVGEKEILKAMQEAATVAAAMAEGAKAEGAARGNDDASER